jgi:hypothetical protein
MYKFGVCVCYLKVKKFSISLCLFTMSSEKKTLIYFLSSKRKSMNVNMSLLITTAKMCAQYDFTIFL